MKKLLIIFFLFTVNLFAQIQPDTTNYVNRLELSDSTIVLRNILNDIVDDTTSWKAVYSWYVNHPNIDLDSTDNVVYSDSNSLFYTIHILDSLFALKFNSSDFNSSFDTRLGTKTTDDLGEGITNKYYSSSLFNTDFSGKSTTDLSEGANLYFTNERVDDRVDAFIQDITGLTWTYNDGANTLTPVLNLLSIYPNLDTDNTNDVTSESDPVWISDSADYYTRAIIDSLLSLHYSITQIDSIFGLYYTQSQVDSIFNLYYTKTESDSRYLQTESDPIYANDSLNIKNRIQSIEDDTLTYADHYNDSDIDGTESAFSGWDKNASDDFDGAYSSLTGTPTKIDSAINADSVDWGGVKNKPTIGLGDMEKSVYDVDDNGKVDSAETADAVDWGGVQNKPANLDTDSTDDLLKSDSLAIYYTQHKADSLLNLFYTKLELDAGQLDNRYYTETEINNTLLGYVLKSDSTTLYYTQYAADNLLSGKLDVSSYTAADVLAKLLTVDGAGSLLDADKLDGQEGSYYLDYTNFTNTPTIPDSANDIAVDASGFATNLNGYHNNVQKVASAVDSLSTGGSVTYLQQVALENSLDVLELQAANTLSGGQSANMIRDVFSDSTGYLNTVDTTNSTAVWVTDKYENGIDGYTYDTVNVNASHGDNLSSQFNTTSSRGLKFVPTTDITLSGVIINNQVTGTRVRVWEDNAGGYGSLLSTETISSDTVTLDPAINLTGSQKYIVEVDASGSSYDSYYIGSGTTGVVGLINFTDGSASGTDNGTLFSAVDGVSYFLIDSTAVYGNDTLQISTQTLSTSPSNFQIFGWKTATTGTGSITADISFDGGSNYQTGVSLDTETAITNTGTSLILKINLNAGASSGTAEAKGFGVMFW